MKGGPQKNPGRKSKFDPIAYWAGIAIIIILALAFSFQYLVSSPAFQTNSNLVWYRRLLYFDYMFILFASMTAVVLGTGLLLLGHNKSRLVGAGFLLGGVIFGLTGLYYFEYIFNRPRLPSNIYESLTMVIATVAGFLITAGMAFIIIVFPRKTTRK